MGRLTWQLLDLLTWRLAIATPLCSQPDPRWAQGGASQPFSKDVCRSAF